jgi:hypothetical protein
MDELKEIHEIRASCVVDSMKHHPRKVVVHPSTNVPKISSQNHIQSEELKFTQK